MTAAVIGARTASVRCVTTCPVVASSGVSECRCPEHQKHRGQNERFPYLSPQCDCHGVLSKDLPGLGMFSQVPDPNSESSVRESEVIVPPLVAPAGRSTFAASKSIL
jgi:hypothetical protein